MEHIFNISELKKRMEIPPKAQRLERVLNLDEFDCISDGEIMEVIAIIHNESQKIIKSLILRKKL